MPTVMDNLRNQEEREEAVLLTLAGNHSELSEDIVGILVADLGLNALKNVATGLHAQGRISYVEQGSHRTPDNPPRITSISLL